MSAQIMTQVPDKLYFRIGEVARLLGVKTYVLRYWQTEFPIVAPRKSSANQRVYQRTDVETLLVIKHLLYVEKYSIAGARKKIRTATEARTGLRTEKMERLHALVRELGDLANTPTSLLFHL